MRPSALPTPFLTTALRTDALASGAMGLALLLAAGPLGDLLQLPAPLLRTAGLILLPFAAFVAWVATRPAVPRGAVRAIVAVNMAWAAASVLLVTIGDIVSPTALGTAFVVLQGLVVLAFAETQWVGLRRAVR